MKISVGEVLINARSLVIWDVLTDTSNVTVWESGIVDIDGEIGHGKTIRIRTGEDKRSSRYRVHQVQDRSMSWHGFAAFGLLHRAITVDLMPQGNGTRLRVAYELGGPLVPFARRIMPSPDGILASFVEAVRCRAELLDRHFRPAHAEKVLSAN